MTFITAIQIANTILPTGNTRNDLLAFLREFSICNHNSPSIREMAVAIDIIKRRDIGKTSTSTINHHLDVLENEGLIERPRNERGQQLRSGRIIVINDMELRFGHRCGECGNKLQLVRPGKWQCNKCGK